MTKIMCYSSSYITHVVHYSRIQANETATTKSPVQIPSEYFCAHQRPAKLQPLIKSYHIQKSTCSYQACSDGAWINSDHNISSTSTRQNGYQVVTPAVVSPTVSRLVFWTRLLSTYMLLPAFMGGHVQPVGEQT